jgi:DNA-nicking Smr family endonuclease
MVPLGAGVNGLLRWKELGLYTLLPVDEEAEKQERAEQARKMANGTPAHQQSTGPPQSVGVQQRTAETQTDEEGDEEDTEGDDDEDEDEVTTDADGDEPLGISREDLLSSDY